MSEHAGSKWLYISSAKGIQNYIFKVGKLKYIIGGSERIENLGTEIDEVLGRIGARENHDYRVIQNAGGNARLLFYSRDHALALAEVWPYIVRKKIPGLQVVQAVVPVTDHGFVTALTESEYVLRANRNIYYPDLPPAEPVVARNRLTGLPVVAINRDAKDGSEMYLDAESVSKLDNIIKTQEKLLERIGVMDRWPGRTWTREFSRIAGEGEYMAVIHADANGLGQCLIKLGSRLTGATDDRAVAVYRQFSTAIESSTQQAFLEAL
ncbi:hypothetical protein JXA80_05965, partial [bacterium]|nr:hypothetical protein [candidate division CSSED10-310 bacterium]